MEHWEGKTAIVTGASSGIGQYVVKDFVKRGINVVAMARQLDLLLKLKDELSECKGQVYPLKVDLNEEVEIVEAFNWISNKLGPVHILINNAAVNIMRETSEAIIEEWKTMFNVNVFAVGSCIREFAKSVKAHSTPDARVINVSSVVAHRYLEIPGFYVYTATKYALNSVVVGIRRELSVKQPSIVISTVSPGYVTETGLFTQHEKRKEDYTATLEKHHGLIPQEVSDSILHILSQPQSVRVDDYVIQNNKATL